jgi:hypothetical protein
VPSALSSTVPASREAYHSFGEVEPAALADATMTENVARGAFATWVRQSPLATEDPNALLREVRLERRYWGRLESEIVARTAVWHERAYTGSQQVPILPRSAAVVDPWAITVEELRRVSHHICRCDICEGRGSVICPECKGRERVQCSNCQGTGKAYGYAKNGSRRLMNCRICGGRLELQCSSCESGMCRCSICCGSGQKERWLEVAETRRVDSHGGPAEHLPHGFPWRNTAAQTSRAEIGADIRAAGVIDTRGVLTEAQGANLAPVTWIEQYWKDLQPAFRDDERVVRQTFSLFEVPIVTLTYSLPGAEPSTLQFEGLRMLAPPVTSDESFATRAQWLRLTRNVLTGIVLGVPLVYLARGEHFRSASVGVIAVCLGVVAFAAYRLVRTLVLYGLARSRRWLWFAGIGAIVLGGLVVQAEPSLRAARQFLSNDHLDAAREELLALGNPGRPDQADLWSALHLAIAKKATDPETIRLELTQIAPRTPQRVACARRLGELVNSIVREQLAAKQWQRAEKLLSTVAPVLSDELRGDAVLGEFGELRALTQDQAFDGCANKVCRLNAARNALTYAVSPVREQRVDDARRNVLAGLVYQSNHDDPALARLKRIGEILALVGELGDQGGDNELLVQARAASETARRERGQVPLLGADSAVLGELLGAANDQGANILKFEDGTVSLYANMRSGRCVGTYIVGSSKEQRNLNDPVRSGTTSRLLSQSFGRAVPLPTQTGGPNSRSSMISIRIGGVPLVARWNGTTLTELRIAEAQP